MKAQKASLILTFLYIGTFVFVGGINEGSVFSEKAKEKVIIINGKCSYPAILANNVKVSPNIVSFIRPDCIFECRIDKGENTLRQCGEDRGNNVLVVTLKENKQQSSKYN